MLKWWSLELEWEWYLIYAAFHAAYCVGLLLARRVLKQLEMDTEYEGNVEEYNMVFRWRKYV